MPGSQILRSERMWHILCFETVAPVAQVGLQLATMLNLAWNFWFSFFYLLSTEIASVYHHACFYVILGINWAQRFVQDRRPTMLHPRLLNTHLCSHGTGLRPIEFLLGTSVNLVLVFIYKVYSRHTMNDKNNTLRQMLKVNVRKATRTGRAEWGRRTRCNCIITCWLRWCPWE